MTLAGRTWPVLPPRDGGPFVALGAALSLAAALPSRFDLLVEWAPLGARALTASLGRSR